MFNLVAFTVTILVPFIFADSKESKQVYIMPLEKLNKVELTDFKRENDSNLYFLGNFEEKKSKKSQKQEIITKVDLNKSSENLKNTLEMFQNSIEGLCISEVELSLAFSVSAKAWVIVSGTAAASVRVIIKNTKKSC